jgi:hypothetical protein
MLDRTRRAREGLAGAGFGKIAQLPHHGKAGEDVVVGFGEIDLHGIDTLLRP